MLSYIITQLYLFKDKDLLFRCRNAKIKDKWQNFFSILITRMYSYNLEVDNRLPSTLLYHL